MDQHDFLQGSTEWHAHRSAHFNASDAPAMLGISPYKTRSQLLHEMATGISPEVDATTQRRFDDGHRFEALARQLAEEIIGSKLFPVVGSDGKLSASFDGITMDESVCFEHKTLNESLRGIEHADDLPEMYRAQMEQQLLVSSAERCLFMASRWDGEELIKEVHCWYEPDMDMRNRIVAGWAQFEKDLADYQPSEIAERPVAEVSIELPSLFVHARGEITTSNMHEYGIALAAKLAEVRAIKLSTDQDFSNAKEAAKLFREQREKLKLAKEAMLSQTVTIGEAARMIDAWSEDLRVTALQLEKDVEREDKAKKEIMVLVVKNAYAEHIAALDETIKPIRLNHNTPNFAEATKGKRNYASMQDALDTALANGKIAADRIAKDVRANLAWFGEYAKGYEALFADLQQIIYKPEDDFDLLVETRIKAHKQAEAEKLEVERQRIQQEEEAKAEAKVKAEQAAANESPQTHAQQNGQDGYAASRQAPAGQLDHSGPPTLRLGQINERLAPIFLTADGLASLGFTHAATDKSAKLYHERDFQRICAALVRHIQAVQVGHHQTEQVQQAA